MGRARTHIWRARAVLSTRVCRSGSLHDMRWFKCLSVEVFACFVHLRSCRHTFFVLLSFCLSFALAFSPAISPARVPSMTGRCAFSHLALLTILNEKAQSLKERKHETSQAPSLTVPQALQRQHTTLCVASMCSCESRLVCSVKGMDVQLPHFKTPCVFRDRYSFCSIFSSCVYWSPSSYLLSSFDPRHS